MRLVANRGFRYSWFTPKKKTAKMKFSLYCPLFASLFFASIVHAAENITSETFLDEIAEHYASPNGLLDLYMDLNIFSKNAQSVEKVDDHSDHEKHGLKGHSHHHHARLFKRQAVFSYLFYITCLIL
jgi:hypothetical protein